MLLFVIISYSYKNSFIKTGKYKGSKWIDLPEEYLLWLRFNSPYNKKASQVLYKKKKFFSREKEIKKLYEIISNLKKDLTSLQPYIPSEKELISKKRAGDNFERKVGLFYEEEGYEVEYRGLALGLKDEGIDLIAIKNREILLIQCKYWKGEYSITSRMIKEFYGSCHFFIDKENLLKENITCIYAIPDKKSLRFDSEQLFKNNYINCRYKVFD